MIVGVSRKRYPDEKINLFAVTIFDSECSIWSSLFDMERIYLEDCNVIESSTRLVFVST